MQQSNRQRRRWVAFGCFAALFSFAVSIYAFVPWSSLLAWAVHEQRGFQNAMAGSLRAIRSGDGFAILSLCSATAAYGFVHALGPGHGKVLIGGAALASGVTLRRMTILTIASSLAQAASAILLVLVVVFLLGWATRDIAVWTEEWLAQASAFAIAGLGLLLVWRGMRALIDTRSNSDRFCTDACNCGHAHGPTLSQVQSLNSIWDALAIVVSIAMRPCTGALFLLVIAVRMDIFAVGCLAVVTMGLGTASFNLVVAASAVTARRFAALPLGGRAMRRFSAIAHVAGGAIVALVSIALARTYLDTAFILP